MLFGEGLPSVMAVAPWFHLDKEEHERKPKGKQKRYLPKRSLLERITGWAYFACNLLTATEDLKADDVWVRNMGVFLLHAYYWMREYEREYSKEREQIQHWFIWSIKPIVEGVLGGRHERPHPELFADVVIRSYNYGFQPDDWPSTAPSEDPIRRDMAKNWILSATIELITNAVSSIEYESRHGRWLERSTQICVGAVDWFLKQKPEDTRSLLSAQCLCAFVNNANPRLNEKQLQTLDNVKKTGTWKGALKFNRLLLLLPTNDHRQWAAGESSVRYIDSRGLTSALSIAIQRIAAAHSDPSTPIQTKLAWYEDFRAILFEAINLGDFDRFAQIRIVDLMIVGAFGEANHQLQIDLFALNLSIFRKLLQFGSNQTFKLLQSWLLEGREVGAYDANLRLRIFEAILLYLEMIDGLRGFEDRPTTIDARVRLTARSRMLRHILACSLVNPSKAGPAFNLVTLTEAKSVRHTVQQTTLVKLGRDLPVECDHLGRPTRLAGADGISLVSTELMLPNLQTGMVRCVGPGPSGLFGHNLFVGVQKNAERCLAVLVASDPPAVSLTPDLRVPVVDGLPEGLVPGELVSVENNPGLDKAPRSASCLRRASAFSDRSVQEWAVRLEPSAPIGACKLWVDPLDSSSRFPQERETWNYLALFSSEPGTRSDYTVRYLVDPLTGRGKRTVGKLADLIIDEAASVTTEQPIVLCLKDFERNSDDSLRKVTVETSPLRDYVLDIRSDFCCSSGEMLSDLVTARDRPDDVRGLLIVATVVLDTVAPQDCAAAHFIGPKIRLAAKGTVATPPWSNIEIHAPIDDRNVRWRTIFEGVEHEEDEASVVTLRARLAEGACYVADLPEYLRVDGFPTQIQLTFGAAMPAHNALLATVDFNRQGNARAGTLLADELKTHKIETDRLGEILGWLMQSECPEKLVHLRHVSRNGVDRLGFISGYTKENLPVQIWAESLTLEPIIEDFDFQKATKRTYVAKPKFSLPRDPTPPAFDLADVPEDAFVNDKAVGIITEVCPGGCDTGLCNVVWRGCFEKPPTLLRIKNLSEMKASPQQGWRITLNRANPKFSYLERMSLMAEALWMTDNRIQPKGRIRLARSEGTQWLKVQEMTDGHLAVENVRERPTDFWRECDQISKDFSVSIITSKKLGVGRFGDANVRRMALELTSKRNEDNRRILAGLSSDFELMAGAARLVGVQYRVQPTPWQNLVKLRRRLEIQAADALPEFITRPTQRPLERHAKAHHKEELAVLLAEPFLVGMHDRKTGRFIPNDARARKLLGDGVPIAPGHYSILAPNDPPEAYARYRDARLTLLEGVPLGSYAHVPPVSLEELAREIGTPVSGKRITLDNVQLSYVGIEAGETKRHIFEWGFGWSVALDENQVRFHGDPLRPNQLVLAFGDQITDVILEHEGDCLIMNIAATKQSPGHVLYKQSKLNIKHILHISRRLGSLGRPEIVKVEGYDGSRHNSRLRPFGRVRPRLAEKSARLIQEIILKNLSGVEDEDVIIINGMLNEEVFNESRGRELVYDAIRIGAEDKGGFRGVKKGDRIFVRAGCARQAGNETLLDVSPLSLIVDQLVDPNIGNPKRQSDGLSITRRNFSYDESALMRITRDDPCALSGVLLVRIVKVENNRITLDHKDVGLRRDPVVLDGLLSRQAGALLCVWVNSRQSGQVDFEVRPGIVISLPKDRIALPLGVNGGLQEGDILEIRRAEPSSTVRYRAQVAILGDRHYALHRRPTVVLPTDRLRPNRNDPRDNLDEALRSFTVGDFRQLFASISQDDETPRAEMALQLTAFMTQKHPKLAWIEPSKGKNDRNSVQICLSNKNNILAGRLTWHDIENGAAPILRIEPLEGCDQSLADMTVDWFDVSCSTGSARALAKHFKLLRWHYHDRYTITWQLTEGGRIASGSGYEKIENSTPQTGPLFFDRVGDRATLRPDAAQMRRWIFSFSNLRSELPYAGRKKERLAFVAGTADTGLFVEAVPGRNLRSSGQRSD